MNGDKISSAEAASELSRCITRCYRQMVELSHLIEKTQLDLISMLESGTASEETVASEKAKTAHMKRELSSLEKEVVDAEKYLQEYYKKIRDISKNN